MNESLDPDAHRWLSIARQLMMHHPYAGLEGVELLPQLRTGWNRVDMGPQSHRRIAFTYIGEDGGRTQYTRPEGVEESDIHDLVVGAVDLGKTRTWSEFERLANCLSTRDPTSAASISRISQSILDAHLPERTSHDVRTMQVLGGRALRQLRSAASRRDVALFLEPAFDIVQAYLGFEISGAVAREVLALVLSVQCNLPLLGPPQLTGAESRMHTMEHLADVADSLLQMRADKDIPGYFELSYLASLYSNTVGVLAAHARAFGGMETDELERLERLALNVEEQFAHHIAPTFRLPAAFDTPDLVSWIVGNVSHGDSLERLARYYCLHPVLVELIQDEAVSDVAAAYYERAAHGESADVTQILESIARPIASLNETRIAGQL